MIEFWSDQKICRYHAFQTLFCEFCEITLLQIKQKRILSKVKVYQKMQFCRIYPDFMWSERPSLGPINCQLGIIHDIQSNSLYFFSFYPKIHYSNPLQRLAANLSENLSKLHQPFYCLFP
jgi:hypothetical protein